MKLQMDLSLFFFSFSEYLAVFKKTVSSHEIFLQRISSHPVLSKDHNFCVFLEYDQDVRHFLLNMWGGVLQVLPLFCVVRLECYINLHTQCQQDVASSNFVKWLKDKDLSLGHFAADLSIS